LKAPPPFASRRHRYPQPIRHTPHAESTGDTKRQGMPDHLDLIQPALQ